MARRSLAAKRYAEAIAAVAAPSGSWDAWIEDLSAVAGAIDQPGVRAVLGDPSQRAAVARFLESGAARLGLRPETRRLLDVMGQRRTLGLLPDVVDWLRELVDAARGVRRVEVTSAFPLDADLQRRVRENVAGSDGEAGKVELSLLVDPGILGGLVIREGDRISDRSVSARLATLRERMS